VQQQLTALQRQAQQGRTVGQAGQHGHERVTGKAGQHRVLGQPAAGVAEGVGAGVDGLQRAAQPALQDASADLARQFVAAFVAHGVVDALEAVEVDEQDRRVKGLARFGGQRKPQQVVDHAAVGQGGDRTGVGQGVDAQQVGVQPDGHLAPWRRWGWPAGAGPPNLLPADQPPSGGASKSDSWAVAPAAGRSVRG
jgi:hypothetical protein